MTRRAAQLLILVTFILQGCDLIRPFIPQENGNIPPIPTDTPGMGFHLPPTYTPIPPTLAPVTDIASTTPAEVATPQNNLLPVEAEKVLYTLQAGTPAALASFPYAGKGCNWMGVGGQVFGLDSQPVTYLVVLLKGTLGGQNIDMVSMTGTALAWGPGGYEFTLADHPIESSGTLWLQVYDLNTGLPVTQPIYFTTYNDCSRNSIMINLSQVRPKNPLQTYYVPLVGRSDLR